MLQAHGRSIPLAAAIVVIVASAACTNAGRTLEVPAGDLQVIETARPIHLEQQPPSPELALPVLTALSPAPELVYFEPLPPPSTHVLSAVTSPAASRKLGLVQSVEVEVTVTGGALGRREISVVFVSPQGLVWQRQANLIDATMTGSTVVQFSLPVASTFIEEQQLFGTWQITSLDEGVELASTTFVLEE